MDSRRAEAFSDGVFAVAITILVFDLLSIGAHELSATVLLHAWPNYFAYVVSFLTIGIMWMNHHTILGQAVYVAGTLIAAFWSPVAALIIFGALAVYYLFEHLPSPAGDIDDGEPAAG